MQQASVINLRFVDGTPQAFVFEDSTFVKNDGTKAKQVRLMPQYSAKTNAKTKSIELFFNGALVRTFTEGDVTAPATFGKARGPGWFEHVCNGGAKIAPYTYWSLYTSELTSVDVDAVPF